MKWWITARTTAVTPTTDCILTYGENEVASEWASQDSYFLSFNSIQQERAGHITKQNKMPRGRGVTWLPVACSPYSFPHDNASSRPSPSSATCSSIKAVSIARTALRHQLSLAPLQPPQSYWVCLSVTKLQRTIDSGLRPSFQIEQASAVLKIPSSPSPSSSS
jgi:hypothetical protein